jgi:hypothetical protein
MAHAGRCTPELMDPPNEAKPQMRNVADLRNVMRADPSIWAAIIVIGSRACAHIWIVIASRLDCGAAYGSAFSEPRTQNSLPSGSASTAQGLVP